MATTTNYGWETPDDTDLVKDGALAMRTTANSIDSTLGTALNNKLHAGLVLIKTQTIGTGVSSVTVTGAFSATYDNYKIIVSGGSGSANNYLTLRLGSSTTGYYGFGYGYNWINNSLANSGVNNASWFTVVSYLNTVGIDCSIEVRNPFIATNTYVNSQYSTNESVLAFSGKHAVSSSYTDFSLITLSGATMTGGTIAVYGYAKD